MTEDHDIKEYQQFRVDLLNSKFKGSHSEKEMVERLIKLCESGNRHALKGLADAKLTYAPDSRMNNSIWTSGTIYFMSNVASPSESFLDVTM